MKILLIFFYIIIIQKSFHHGKWFYILMTKYINIILSNETEWESLVAEQYIFKNWRFGIKDISDHGSIFVVVYIFKYEMHFLYVAVVVY